ncbi:MAG: hypothetical protein DLM72_05345 [Candidatus Nitrosopolaris wilkensis]|nr:MAG: hypothetical protein DLM72_05345 [Candidatus Nitrosopolaris wilkensis]
MDRSIISKPSIKAALCEANDCFAGATIEIRVRVGDLGSIALLLCNNCRRKFTEYEFAVTKKSRIRNDESITSILTKFK